MQIRNFSVLRNLLGRPLLADSSARQPCSTRASQMKPYLTLSVSIKSEDLVIFYR